MDKCWKFSIVSKCTKVNKERNKESGFGFALAPWENVQARTLFWVSYISQLSRVWPARLKTKLKNRSPQWQTQTYSELPCKVQVPGTWNKKVLLFGVGPFRLFWSFFTTFWILGRYKKSKRRLSVSLYPC